jgi:hypothetical protein
MYSHKMYFYSVKNDSDDDKWFSLAIPNFYLYIQYI